MGYCLSQNWDIGIFIAKGILGYGSGSFKVPPGTGDRAVSSPGKRGGSTRKPGGCEPHKISDIGIWLLLWYCNIGPLILGYLGYQEPPYTPLVEICHTCRQYSLEVFRLTRHWGPGITNLDNRMKMWNKLIQFPPCTDLHRNDADYNRGPVRGGRFQAFHRNISIFSVAFFLIFRFPQLLKRVFPFPQIFLSFPAFRDLNMAFSVFRQSSLFRFFAGYFGLLPVLLHFF